MSRPMTIEMKHIAVRDLVNGYDDRNEVGVVGFGGSLDIRPPYQREFVYDDKKRAAVIETLRKGFPLNVMYWAVNPGAGDDGSDTFEVIDGQQRTISICQFVANKFSVLDANGDPRYFSNLTDSERTQVLDYELSVYHCTGDDDEKLEWFKTINIAGEQLSKQELRNAVYTGRWLADAKKWFSRTGCPAYGLASKYVTGSPIRQDFLETALDWRSQGDIRGYMATHQHDATATDLWSYFQSVITWVEATFPTYRREMKGLSWGPLFDEFGARQHDPAVLEDRVAALMADDDVTAKKGIYSYVLDGRERHLSIRTFTPSQKREAYERQNGICVKCEKKFELSDMQADHVEPWSKGGKTVPENCQMLCQPCNGRKSNH